MNTEMNMVTISINSGVAFIILSIDCLSIVLMDSDNQGYFNTHFYISKNE